MASMTQIRDILRGRKLFWVESGRSVAEVARRMSELEVGAILVLENEELRGIFSERDLMTRVVVEGRDPALTPVMEVMSRELVTIEETATPEEALARMHACGCRHLPVMRGSEVVAFLSMRDLMEHRLAETTDELGYMRAYIHGYI